MEQDPKVVPTGQCIPNTPHHKGTEAQLNPEGGALQAAPYGGQGDPNTIATGDYCGQNPLMGGYHSGWVETTNGAGMRSFRDEGIAYGCLYQLGNTEEGSRHNTVGQTGECDEDGVSRGVPPERTDMDNSGANY